MSEKVEERVKLLLQKEEIPVNSETVKAFEMGMKVAYVQMTNSIAEALKQLGVKPPIIP
ncbi:MAG: hypothetical protein ACE5Z5_08385 [Candidatus Bathyarchaeia archaeon]